MPRFSIVVPCFNAEPTIRQTLQSLRSQTVADIEIICVDDASTDRTRELILKAKQVDPRVRLVRNTGLGPSDARNFGALDLAKGDIIAFCDADDLWAPTKLAHLEAAFRSRRVDAVYAKVAFFQTTPADSTTHSRVPLGDLKIPQLLGENPVCTMSNIAVRRDVFAATQGFNSEIVHNEDLEWLIRLVGNGATVTGINETLTYYRRSVGGLSNNLPAMLRGREAALKTAARFGYSSGKRDNAIYMRYLARRALRMGQSRAEAARFSVQGVFHSPAGFFASPRRGTLTLCGSLAALVLPRRISHMLFAR